MKLQKETTRPERSLHGRWYDDACGTAFALELVGERWTLLIVRELMFGGRRFSDIRAGLPGISAKVLTERLEGLEAAGIVQRRQLAPPASGQVYELTQWGYLADEAVQALGRWAARSSQHDPTLPISIASLMMSFRTMFDPRRVRGAPFAVNLQFDRERFVAQVGDGAFTVERGETEHADATIAAPSGEPLAALVYGKVAARDLAPAGLAVSGDADVVARFVDLFHLPAKLA